MLNTSIKKKSSQTSIASEIPGIADISPPMTFSVNSRFLCRQKHKNIS